MDLVQILNNILLTKNEIRDILGENNNIARYSVSIHNLLAVQYNAAYRLAFHDRYYELTGSDRWLAGPQEILEYNVNPAHYEAFTPEILTDIMRDVLNYRLNMKDEMNVYIEPDIDDNFVDYPDYLRGLLERIIGLGAEAGINDADEAYDGNEDVDVPTFIYADNMFTLSSEQTNATIWFSLGENGVPTIYTGPVIISEPVDVYYWAKLGRSESAKGHTSCTINPNGNVAFVWPPTVYQENNRIIMSSTSGASIQYSIDGGEWAVYYGPVQIQEGMQSVKAMAVKNNEYSKYIIQPLSYEGDIDQYRPANVKCTIVDNGSYRTVTLTCETAGANIYYAIDEADGYYRNYSGPFNVESNHFLIYTYAVKNGYESKLRLVYKWDVTDDTTIPADVQFIDEGTSVTMYTTTPSAKVNYRYGPVGSFTEASSNAVSVTLDTPTDIYAYATLNGVHSRNETRYSFTPYGTTTRPPEPTMYQEGNTIFIVSPYEVRYTTNLTDPRTYGIVYNKAVGITITEFTTIKAIAIYNNVYSTVATASFRYDDSSQGGGSGSSGGQITPTNPTNGTDTGEPFVAGNWFAVTGATGLSFNGSNVYFATEGDTTWKTVTTTSISGLTPDLKTYFKGTINNITAFSGQATISGDLSSIKGGVIGEADKNYKRMFANCSGLYNASGLLINITNMPESMMEEMFMNCTDLHEATFSINAAAISDRGMYGMFNGCTNLQGGPQFNITSAGNNGLFRCFYGCSKLTSVGSFNLTSAGMSAFNGCFYGCTNLTGCSFSTPSGTAPDSVCYMMFYGCSALNDVSRISLNYSTMSTNAYAFMFYNTTALRSAMILSATTMAPFCYAHMFEKSGIMTPPVINANTLANSCFDSMFRDCINLTSSPDLNVEYLHPNVDTSCYANMFYGCSSLQHIKAMFLNTPSAGQYTGNWVYGVPSGGTFEVNREASWPLQSNAFGPNAIPVNSNDRWTVVGAAVTSSVVINEENGMCILSANSGDEIWYLDSSAEIPNITTDLLTKKYTEKFRLNWKPTWVYAAAKNSDGIFGQIASAPLMPNLPALVIYPQGNRIYITNPHDYTYDSIWYELKSYDETTQIQALTQYTLGTPIVITDSVTVIAYGYVGTAPAVTTILHHIFGLNPPTISVYVGHVDSDNPLYYVGLSYPGEYISMYWKLNDNEQDTPDTSTAWRLYSGNSFRLNDYFTSGLTEYVVSAIAKVNYQGNEVWSPLTSTNIGTSTSAVLSDPQLIQLPNSNTIRVVYEGQEYPYWDSSETGMNMQIEYKIGQGGEVKEYTGDFNLTGVVDNPNVYIYVRARRGNFWTTTNWDVYGGTPFGPFNFSLEHLHFDMSPTEITEIWDDVNHVMTIYVNNPTESDGAFPVYNYIWIEPLGYDASGFTVQSTDDVYFGWVPITASGQRVNQHLMNFKVHAYTRKNNDTYPADWPTSDISKEYDISNWWNWSDRPEATVIVGANRKVTITIPNGWDETPKMKIVPTEWGTGTTNESKYAEWQYVTAYDDFGKESTAVWSGHIDEHLASGTIYVKYLHEGIESSGETGTPYRNSNVSPLVAPTINPPYWDRNKQAYILKITNSSNPGVIIKYRIDNCKWSGGVVNENKYATERVCGLYGDTLDYYLIEGDIVAITIYDPHGSNQRRESAPYHFVNEHYTRLPVPQISIVEKTNNNAVKVTNTNKNATNYWRCTYANSNWTPSAVNPHKYDNWQTAFTTDNDLDTALLNGTIEAYSYWGNENTLDEIVTFNYDTGITIDDDPPSIDVTPSTDFYNVTITNNADTANYYNLKWKVDDIVWNSEEDVNCFWTNYNKDIGDGYLIENRASSFTFTIGKDVMSGTIMAFYTNETNNTQVSNRTPITVVEFTNELI